MIDEPTTAPINEDDNQPATRRQFRDLKLDVEGIDRRLVNVEAKVDKLGSRVETLEGTVQTVLDIVKTIDENTRDLPDFKRRVIQNEEAIFKLQSRTR